MHLEHGHPNTVRRTEEKGTLKSWTLNAPLGRVPAEGRDSGESYTLSQRRHRPLETKFCGFRPGAGNLLRNGGLAVLQCHHSQG